jgi:NAD(P)-dependent dehydrogenase (short-subunit alcohol dehydrogenase family)
MSKTIVIVGYGPGISTAVANKFGAEGFSVALVARNAERLAAGVAALKAKGVAAAAFPADASDPVALRGAIQAARAELGPVGVLHWNAFSGHEVGDLLTAEPDVVRDAFGVPVVGLLSAVQEVLPDLKAAKDGAVLVTNGAFGDLHPMMDMVAINLNSSGVGLGNAAKAKLVGLLSARLQPEGVYVGEVTIAGAINGTSYAPDGGGIDGSVVADAFWRLYQARGDVRARVS